MSYQTLEVQHCNMWNKNKVR